MATRRWLSILSVATLALLLCALGASAQTPAAEGPGAEAPAPAADAPAVVFRAEHLGHSWVNLSWRAPGDDVSIEWRATAGSRADKRWRRLDGITGSTWTIPDLRPATPYLFRLHAMSGTDAQRQEVAVAETEATTLEALPLRWENLFVLPTERIPASPQAATWACIEGYSNSLYLLEAGADGKLLLHRLNPSDLKALWTRELTVPMDGPADFRAPDTCVFRDRLWVTWHSRRPGRTPQEAPRYRLRLACVDLPALETAPPGPVSLGAVMEMAPRYGGTSTCWGSLAVFQDAVWMCWTEYRPGPMGVPRSNLIFGAYDPEIGYVADPITWRDAPTNRAERGQISLFGPDLQVLFSDAAVDEKRPGVVPLMAARFDGLRFLDVHLVRNIGANAAVRGVQYFDKYYFAYETDAAYPTGAGMFRDLNLGRFAPAEVRGLAALDLLATGFPLVTDFTRNVGPDLTVLGDDLFVSYTKWQERTPPPDDPLGHWAEAGGGAYVRRLRPALQ